MNDARPGAWDLPRQRSPSFVAALAMAVDLERYLEGCRARRGDPFVVELPSLGPILVTGHPEGARAIFSAPMDVFEPVSPNPVEPLLGRHSLLLLAGEKHRRERRLMTPSFHGERMRAYGTIIRDTALAELATWRPSRGVNLQDAMRRITLHVIMRAVLGVEGEEKSARFTTAISTMLSAYTPALLILPFLRRGLGGLGPWDRLVDAREAVCALFRQEIAARRQTGTAGREDILSLLMDARYEDGSALSEDELIDELRTLIVGGHDTTTTALAWTLFHVQRSPSVLATLLAELDALGSSPAPEQLAQLPYLGAVCNEALRLHPIVPVIPRRCLQPFSLRGVAVTPGQNVAVATTLLHTNSEVWSEPSRFDPARFLTRQYGPFEYAPFGGGVRRCIGAAFGAYQMRIVVGTILASLRLETRPARTPARALKNITMAPRAPIHLRVVENRHWKA
ncbi:MAG TPA: cytochrome P450 [Polyangia bacterium]|nr:cytochrome P450 [Polyangia bacterium]